MERFFCSDMDLHPQQFLKILNQPRMIEQASARLPCDKKIEVATLGGLTASDGAEHTQIVSPAFLSNAADMFTLIAPQLIQCDHLSPLCDKQPHPYRPSHKQIHFSYLTVNRTFTKTSPPDINPDFLTLCAIVSPGQITYAPPIH